MIPMSSSIVGLFVNVLPFIPKRGTVCFNFINLSKLLYSLITSWILSLFKTAFIMLLRAETYFIFTTGRGTMLPNLPFFTLKRRSKLSTFSCEGSSFPCIFYIFLGSNYCPLNYYLRFMPVNGLFHRFEGR